MSWSDWPFILSSVFAQLVIGAFISLGCVILSGKLCFGQSDRVHRTMPALWLMMFVSLVLREGNLMLMQQHSPFTLTNEVLLAIVFFGLAIAYWFVEKALIGPDLMRKVLLVNVMLVGVVYLVNGFVVRGSHWLVISHFLATTLVGGLLFGHAALVRAKHKVEQVDKLLPILGSLLALGCFVLGAAQLTDLEAQGQANELNTALMAQIASLGGLIAAVGVWLMPLITRTKPVQGVMTLAIFLIVVSSFLAGIGI
ncbi:dimethylsulfoxide reductase [Photobacterium jeanii]|uniref:Dimethylsulfoxide reductase n=1 Tax=Photobacterium jeanii TaxID=858640 RepID=A0A178K432_9GAMM|nr:DmsC/YnfH family molybdoenzyme membrane anchor subunit [Photobacterium jeanii]OAN11504.1 dimethylsulfoxide reductase [Photobacterium jeanii]PST91023.1 dimethylsulfoxide reductase [Photobacterium jeanii]